MAQAIVVTTSLESSSTQNRHQLRVLLVEDSPVQQQLIACLLQRLGHVVRIASDGFEALSAVQSHEQYDVILMDCQMQLMDGFRATKFLKELERVTGKLIPIIGISATASSDEALMSGMDDFLSKPLDQLTVKTALEQLIR